MTPPGVVFALAKGQNTFFRELAEALVFELGRLGAGARIVVGDFPRQEPGSVTVLLPPHEYAALGARPTPAMLRRCVVISAEQPTSEFFEWNVVLARDAGAVLDINRSAVRSYEKRGIAATHLQLGYSDIWNRRDEVSERDIDVLFVGRASPRRLRALALYADQLERLNCEILLSDDSSPDSADGHNFQAGDARLRLLARSKVVLNLHGEDETYFEWLRVAEALSCGCAVVTEHSTDLEPLRVGIDLIAGRPETLGLLAASVVKDEELRRRLVYRADARLRRYATLAGGAAALLAAAERTDAISVDSAVAASDRRALRALERQQQEPPSFHRRLAADAPARSRPERPRAQTVMVGATAAWKHGGDPRVSVIVPVYNDIDVVHEALDSVRRSTFADWEIIAVDDASIDGSGDTVLGWMGEHSSAPVALFRHDVNRGLAAARNTGVARARGRLLLMLDSDKLIRPFGLARLVRALAKDPHAAFAYGILDRFNADGPVDVANNFGWDPARFRDGNYIDVPALIRRSYFDRLGGYSEDARHPLGSEDYDFWARVAEAGKWAIFVRQFVGSYRVGGAQSSRLRFGTSSSIVRHRA